MKRVFWALASCAILWGASGCTPAGKPSEDDSFSLPSSEGEGPAPSQAMPALKPPTDAPRAAEPPGSETAAQGPSADAAADSPKPSAGGDHTIALGSKLKMTAPEAWISKAPAMQMISQEFAVPAAEGDAQEGRVTVMTAGGTVEANVERWIGQFSQPDGAKTADRAKIEKKTVAGQEVHVVDLSGTYNDARGPFAPAVERPGYRMLAAIIPTEEGTFFLKFYGPRKTVGAQEKAFHAMVEGMK